MTQLVPAFTIPSVPFQVSRSYWTDIIVTRAGKEQRRANRNYPRRHYTFTTSAGNTRWLEYTRFLMTGQRQFGILADESRRLTIVSVSGSDIVVAALPNWAVTGMWLVLADFVNKSYATTQITGLSGSTITVSPAPSITSGYLYAGIQGWVTPNTQYDLVYNSIINPKVEFDEDPGYYVAEPALTAFGTWNGREVWVYPPNKFMQQTVTAMAGMELVDFNFLRISNFDITGLVFRTFLASWGMREDEADKFRAFFDRMKGSRGEFYMPTWEPDLTAMTTAAAGTNTLTIQGPEVYNLYNGSTLFTMVCVFLDNARIPSVMYNTIGSMAIVSGNTVITFPNNWTHDVTPAHKISWMPVWRWATDSLQLSYQRGPAGDMFVATSMTMRMLEDLTGS